MTYRLFFLESAKKEWDRLAKPIQQQFKKKIAQRLETPHIPKDKLRGMNGCYKIKLRQIGYRLVYQVIDKELIVSVVAVGKRDKNMVYDTANKRV
jgi:mRNA interferase RelE/StbE